MKGRAADEWARSYVLTEGGEVDVNSPNGGVEVEAADGDTVDVRANRIAHATSDQAAAEILPRISIKEDVSPEKIALRTEPLGGIVIGVSVEVHYHVRAPRSATIRARAVNGRLTVKGFTGRVILTGVKGGVTAEALSGSVEVRSTNAPARIAIASFKADLVDIRVTNGSLRLTLPDTANANLNASATNGTIDVSALNLEKLGDQTGRRVRGRLNAGGAPIELVSVNGNITVESAPASPGPANSAPAKPAPANAAPSIQNPKPGTRP